MGTRACDEEEACSGEQESWEQAMHAGIQAHEQPADGKGCNMPAIDAGGTRLSAGGATEMSACARSARMHAPFTPEAAHTCMPFTRSDHAPQRASSG
jgi:hypothetical protein